MFDLISIGDTVVDTIIPLEKAEITEKNGVKQLLMPYGVKIPVAQSTSTVGGNAANAAVGASRLGLKTAIYTNVGNKDEDEADSRILAKFKKEKVDTRYVSETNNLPSNHNIVLTFEGERTILIHHQPWKFNLPDLDRSKWIYLTSLSPSYTESNLIEQIINYIERTRVKLVYQPGTFQIKVGIKKSARLLSLCQLIIVNLEEAKTLLGHEVNDSVVIKKLLKNLSDLGPKKVVITDAEKGSYGFDGQKFFKIGVFPAKLVEMTGSGDAYTTGLVAGLHHGNSLDEAMRWGAANSSSVVEKVGPQEGLLTKSKMEERLKEYYKIHAEEF